MGALILALVFLLGGCLGALVMNKIWMVKLSKLSKWGPFEDWE